MKMPSDPWNYQQQSGQKNTVALAIEICKDKHCINTKRSRLNTLYRPK